MKHIQRLLIGLIVIAIVAGAALPAVPPASAAPPADEPTAARCVPVAPGDAPGQNLWQPVAGTPPPARPDAQPAISPVRFQAYTLNRDGMTALLATAPLEFSPAARTDPLVLALPNP